MADKQNSILLSLREIIEEVSTKSSFEDTVTTLVEKIRKAANCDCCSLYLLNSRKTFLCLEATDGLQKESIGKVMLQVGEGLVGLRTTKSS